MVEPYRIVYSYDDVPVIRKFAQANKRIRGLMGPFGCLSEDTEYLTPLGWKRIDQYKIGEKIAQYDSNTRKMFFDFPVNYINEINTEPMLHFLSRGLDMMLTPNHRVLFNKKYNPEKLQVISAQEVFDAHQQLTSGWDGMVPTAFEWDGQGNGIFLSDDDLRLMVAVCADGHFPKNRHGENFCSICLRRIRKRERIVELLNRCGISFNVRNYPSRPTEFTYDFVAPEKNKTLTKYWSASKRQLSIILDEMVYWDGCEENRCKVRIFSTCLKEDADFMQYVFACHNIRASISLIHQAEGQRPCYNVIENQSKPFVGMRHDTQKPLAEKVNQDRQYCFETKTGFFVARRNDKIFITGNSGKSSGCVMEIIRRAHEQAPSQDGIRRTRWAIIRSSFPQLKDTTIRTVFDWLPVSVFGEYSITNHNFIITKFPGVQIELMFRALDRPEQVANLLSLELTGAWVNEAREVNWEIIDALDGRINRYPGKKDGGCTWCGIIMDTNPPDENSEWYKYFEVKRPSTAAIFKQPSGLSPQAENLKNLAKDYYKTLAIGKNDQYVRVYIEGKYGYTQEGKAVIEQYNDNVHVALSIIQPMEDVPLITGWDWGLNPTLILAQITPRGKLLILDEFGSDGMGLRQFLQNIVQPQLRMNYFGVPIQGGYGDPAGASRAPTDESTCYEVLRELGFKNILPCPTNALLPRIAAVEGLLTKMIDGEPALVISPKCVMLRKGLNGGYHRQRIPGTQNEYSDQPFKNVYSHYLDALQYLCYYVNDSKNKNKRNEEFLKRIGKQTKHRPASSIAGM